MIGPMVETAVVGLLNSHAFILPSKYLCLYSYAGAVLTFNQGSFSFQWVASMERCIFSQSAESKETEFSALY